MVDVAAEKSNEGRVLVALAAVAMVLPEIKGIRVLWPWRATDDIHYPCASGRVARSLSAIR